MRIRPIGTPKCIKCVSRARRNCVLHVRIICTKNLTFLRINRIQNTTTKNQQINRNRVRYAWSQSVSIVSVIHWVLFSNAAEEAWWRTTTSRSQSVTRTGFSRTATAATGSKWPWSSTWPQSLAKGIDRDIEAKDGGSPISSLFKCVYHVQLLEQGRWRCVLYNMY